MQVAAEQTIAAPASEVWQVISAPGNLDKCHPYCEKNTVHRWPGPDSVDEIRYLSGWVYQRRFREWHEGKGYDLEIFRGDERQASVAWRIIEIDSARCKLRITVRPLALRRFPAVVRWIPFHVRVRPLLRSYLQSVALGFRWYVERGEPVPRNQFGTHPWFSS